MGFVVLVRHRPPSGIRISFEHSSIHAIPRLLQVLALAVSGDGRYLASGGRDRLINVWDCRTDTVVETFRGHQDTVSCLAFRANSLALFSGSHDRCVKVRARGSVASINVALTSVKKSLMYRLVWRYWVDRQPKFSAIYTLT